MMNFDVMRRLVAEAETGAMDMPTAQSALAHWGNDAGTLRHLRYSATAIYTFQQAGARRILRLSHPGDRARDQIQAELDFITYLASVGIPAMPALPGRSGEMVVTVDSWTRFYAAVFEYAPGDTYLELENLSMELVTAWGRTMAQLHLASQTYKPAAPVRRPQWQETLATLASWLPADERAAHNYLAQASAWLSSLPSGPEDYGLIHWDLCIDNLSWDSTQYHIFDFDDAAYFWYAADLAFALDDLQSLPPEPRQRILAAFLDGYRSLRPSIDDWLECLPRFYKFMYLFKYARDLRAMNFANPTLDPPWMSQLRLKLTRANDEWRKGFEQAF